MFFFHSFIGKGLGAVVWDCGVLLSQLLVSQPQLVAGARVLELGSGTVCSSPDVAIFV